MSFRILVDHQYLHLAKMKFHPHKKTTENFERHSGKSTSEKKKKLSMQESLLFLNQTVTRILKKYRNSLTEVVSITISLLKTT